MRRSMTTGMMVIMLAFAVGFGCGGDDPAEQDSEFFFGGDGHLYSEHQDAKLVVDASRSGVADFDDVDDMEHRWEPDDGYGALFLANLDDDAQLCQGLEDDRDFETCYDAAIPEVVDDVDLEDMARIKTWPLDRPSPKTVGVLDVDEASRDRVRLYMRTGDDDSASDFVRYEPGEDRVEPQALEDGVEFAIEGRALVDDRESWDGTVELTWEIEVGEVDKTDSDQVYMEQAPVLFPHHMQSAKRVYASDLGADNAAFVDDLDAAVEQAGVEQGLKLLDTDDPWTQDFLQTGMMAIPGPDGPQVIRVYFRSANLNYPESLEPLHERRTELEGRAQEPLLRRAGRVVFTEFHGPGTAGRAEYDGDKGFDSVDLEGVDKDDALAYLFGESSQEEYPEIAELYDRVQMADTLDSFGNTETVPPHVAPDGSEYPHGRVFRGKGLDSEHFRPDPTLTSIIDAQDKQPVIWIDTSWKSVAHVDETISFVETDTDRGWSMLYNDPVRAKELLEKVRDEMDGGDALLFEGKEYPGWFGGATPAEITVEEVLDDTEIMEASARAAVEVDDQVDILQQEVGIDDDELVPIAFLHEDFGWGSVAYQPGIVNGIVLEPDFFGAPDPHGPVIDGQDVFKRDVEDLFEPLGVDIEWIETWDVYHVGSGQVHCGSDTTREAPDTPWWVKESN